MPQPNQNETEEQFISRCIPVVLDDGSAESDDQAVAMCSTMWDNREKSPPKRTNGPSERKMVPNIGLKIIDEAQGIVEHIITVFGVLDDGNDISHPGSFQQTITGGKGKNAKVLDSHNTGSIMAAIGVPVQLFEVDRAGLPPETLREYPEATGGLKAHTRFLLDTPEGHGAFVRLRDGAVDEWSYGYDTIDPDFTMEQTRDGQEARARNLRQNVLWEYSPVLWGMNPATSTISAKSADDEQSDPDPQEQKIGRAISAARAGRISDALAALVEVLESAGIDVVGFSAEPEPDDDQEKNALLAGIPPAAATEPEAEQPPDSGPVITSEAMVSQIEALKIELQLLEVQ